MQRIANFSSAKYLPGAFLLPVSHIVLSYQPNTSYPFERQSALKDEGWCRSFVYLKEA